MDAELNFKSKSKKRLIIISTIALATIGLGLFYLTQSTREESSSNSTSSEVVTQEKPILRSVSALGRLEPEGEVIQLASSPNLGGAKVVELLIDEGDQVEKDQIIAILDSNESRLADVERAQREIEVAEANLAIVKAGAKQGEINAQKATIERLEAELEWQIITNEARISRLEAQLEREKEQLNATVNRVKSEQRNAESEYQRHEYLANEGVISESELDNRKLILETAQERVKEAEADYKKSLETLQQEIKETKAISNQSVRRLEKQIDEAKAELDRIAEVRDVDVIEAQAQVEMAKAVLKQAKAGLKLSYVKAPFKSQILKIHTYPGESVSEDDGIVEIGKTDQMFAVAEVYESNISKVTLGQAAEISSENNGFEGKLTGIVSKIGNQIGKKDVLDTDPAADVDARVVEVEIKLDPQSSQRVSNLSNAKVFVEILL